MAFRVENLIIFTHINSPNAYSPKVVVKLFGGNLAIEKPIKGNCDADFAETLAHCLLELAVEIRKKAQ